MSEVDSMWGKVKMIINNAPLSKYYPNMFDTQSFVIGRQLLYSSSNTTSTVARNLTILSSTTDKISASVINFWIDGDIDMQ